MDQLVGSDSVGFETIVVLGPSSEDGGEVAVDEESPDPVAIEPCSALVNALFVGDGTAKVNTGGLLELGDSFVSLLELLISAGEFGESTGDDVVSVDEGAGNDDGEDPHEKSVLSALFAAGNPAVEEGEGHQDGDGELRPEDLEVSFVNDGVGSTRDGTEDHKDREELDTAFEREAEAAGFSHMSISINKNYKNTL